MKRAAIEGAGVEMLELFERVSEEAKREKNAVPPTNKLVYYWTRKPLVVGRAVALACTLERPEHVKELLGLNPNKRAYKSSPDLERYQNLIGRDPSEIKMLDPFAGTGNLAFPAAELGLDVTCSDYNPLAHIIERGSLEIPAASGPGLAGEFEGVANDIINEVYGEVGRFYKPRHLAYIWAWCIRCTHCGQRVPLLNQMYLSKKNKTGLKIIPTRNRDFVVEIDRNIAEKDGRSFTQRHGKAQCISCRNTITYDAMTSDIARNRDREMLAIQVQKPGRQGRDYILPSENNRRLYRDSVKHFDKVRGELDELIPQEIILPSHRIKNLLWNYGIEEWGGFFSPRQLLVLATLAKRIKIFHTKPHDSSLKPYLSFLMARLVDSYSYGVTWNTSRDTPEATLAMRRPSIVFNSAEINPFEKVRGSLRNNTSNILKAIEFCATLNNPVSCKMESVTVPSNTQYDLIITDPPYGDDVQYGELSEFFYLWMYRVLDDATLPTRVPLDEDFCESQGRFGDKKLASEFFEKGLKKSFASINHKLKDDGLLVVFFSHSTTQTWNQLLMSLHMGGFRVVSSYALHTESTSNPLARNKTSFMSSIVVTCRKILHNDSSGFWEDIIPDMEDQIRDILEGIPEDKLLTIPIPDLLIMVYGKVLESCTKHATLKSRSGLQTKYNFESLLSDASHIMMRFLVSRLTQSNLNVVGGTMAFYITVKVFQGGRISADDMLKMTKAYNIKPRVLEESGVITRNGGAYTLMYLHENEMDTPPDDVKRDDLHQQLCYLARLVHIHGAGTADDTLDRENFRRDMIKRIVHVLLKSFHMRKNRKESLDIHERAEMQALKTLADIMGIRNEEGLDTFM